MTQEEMQSRIIALEKTVVKLENILSPKSDTPEKEINPPVPEVTAKQILKIVCDFSGLTERDLTCKSRKREFVDMRHMAMSMIHIKTSITLKNIGMMFGGRDHSTVLNAKKKHHDLLATDRSYRTLFININQSFESWYTEVLKYNNENNHPILQGQGSEL